MSYTLINGDCMDYMRDLPDNAFELAVVDPPYGISVTSMNMGSRKTVKPSLHTWDKKPPEPEYFAELLRAAENHVVWGGNYFGLPPSQYFAIWDKGPTMYGRDFAECEYAWVRSGGTRILRLSPNQLDRIHVTQKPVQLYEWLYTNYAKSGDRILDTHGGSMSSVIAAINLGFDITCIEKDKNYFEVAKQRIKNHEKQPPLFEMPLSQPEQGELAC